MKTCLQTIIFSIVFCALHVSAREPDKHGLQQFAQSSNLAFVANAGQITDQYYNQRKDIDFKLNAPGMDIFIGDGEIHYQWNRDSGGLKNGPAAAEAMPGRQAGENDKVEIYRLDVELIGANKNAKIVAEEKQGYYERYYLAFTPEEGIQAYSYKKITYKDIYPHIDWVLYVSDNQLKYDFVVHPGGDPKNIKLKYEGASTFSILKGALTVTTPFGSVTEQAPYSYEAERGKEVTTRYILDGNALQFETAPYTGTLVIDPVLAWATYYGGAGDTQGFGVATDAGGAVYLAGITQSTTNIATAGTHQVNISILSDGFIAKFNSLGVRQWGTYYGGNQSDDIRCIKTDAGGGVYVAGITSSTTGIATPASHQPARGNTTVNGSDAFLAKFDAAGQRVWATYYGGLVDDGGTSLTIDNAGSIYIGGYTESDNNISSPGCHQPIRGHVGYKDAFLAKFNSAGVRQWGTYYGGEHEDYGQGLITDGTGAVYFAGRSSSTTGISTPGSYQPNLNFSFDAFLVKFNTSGVRQWGTYFGGPGIDELSWTGSSALAYDAAGFIYLSAITASTSGIATPGSHQPAFGGGKDAFLAKFNLNGALQWGTYYGGSSNEDAVSVYTGPTGIVYLCGGTQSNTAIATPGSYQPALAGNKDAYLTKFSPSGQRIEGTYYGGSAEDAMFGMAFSGTADVYICGHSNSSSGIATPGSHQPALGGALSAFLAKFVEDTAVFVQPPFVDTLKCKGQTLQVAYGTVHSFKLGNVFTVQLSDASGSFASPVNIGTAVATGAGIINCVIPLSTPAGSGYRIRVVATNPVRTSQDNGLNIHISDIPAVTASANTPVCVGNTLNLNATNITGVTYSWTGPVSFTANIRNPIRIGMTTAMGGDYIVTANNNGCIGKDTVTVAVISVQNPTIGGTGACLGGTLNLSASTTSPGATYSWNGPNSFSSNLQNPSITGVTAAAAGTYTVIITAGGCSTTLTTNVSIGSPPATPTAGSNSPVCAGQSINLTALSSTPGVTYSWTGPGSYSSNLQNPTRTSATVAMSGTYTATAISNGCGSAPASTTVVVNASPAAPVATNNGPLCAGVALDLFATGQPGATYQWNGPGSYSSTTQNPTILNVNTSHAGTYTVTQTVGGCTSPAASTNVVINNSVTPTINVYPNPNDTVCPGTLVTFVAVQTNGGTNPQYQWYKNGNPISGANLNTYQTTTYNNGDYYSCQLTSNAFCAVPQAPMSSNVILTVVPPAPAQVSITANPGLVLSPWEMVIFTATPLMGGIAPTYQWLRNGKPVIGATSNTWGANNLSNGDTISVVLTSSDPCAIPNTDTSNLLVVNIKTGISGVNGVNGVSGLSLYPNPNNGSFTVKGNINAKDVLIEVVNAIGQVVYSSSAAEPGRASSQEFEHNIHLDVASGVYLLRVKSDSGTEVIRFDIFSN